MDAPQSGDTFFSRAGEGAGATQRPATRHIARSGAKFFSPAPSAPTRPFSPASSFGVGAGDWRLGAVTRALPHGYDRIVPTKVREAIKIIREDGWYEVSTRGSHRQFKHPSKAGCVTIAGKLGDDLAPKTYDISFDRLD